MAQRTSGTPASATGGRQARQLRVAVDGPVGAGKSSAGRLLAARLGYRFLDTGLMYRAVTVAALDAGVRPDDAAALAVLAHNLDIRLAHASGHDRLLLDGHDITARLRTQEVERNISAVSAVAGVREALVALQRKVAASGGIVMVGRDIGTVVLKDAEIKFYLTAPAETRARRRHDELAARGSRESYDEVLKQLLRRDQMDSERAESPLSAASDAVVIESDGKTLEQVVAQMESAVRAHPGQA